MLRPYEEPNADTGKFCRDKILDLRHCVISTYDIRAKTVYTFLQYGLVWAGKNFEESKPRQASSYRLYQKRA
jgi:hypothetical protein